MPFFFFLKNKFSNNISLFYEIYYFKKYVTNLLNNNTDILFENLFFEKKNWDE